MKWAEKVRHLTPDTLASSARLAVGSGGIKAMVANKQVLEPDELLGRHPGSHFVLEPHLNFVLEPHLKPPEELL